MARYTLPPAAKQRWASLVAKGAGGSAALRIVLGQAAVSELSEDALRSRAHRLLRSEAAVIDRLRKEQATTAKDSDRPLDAIELTRIAAEITFALSRAIEAGEALGLPPAVVVALRKMVGAHAARLAKMPLPDAVAASADQGDPLSGILDRLRPCFCGDAA